MGRIRQKVALQNVQIYAYHGFYPEEQLTGTLFSLDVETEFAVGTGDREDLSNTVNYERLHTILSEEMKVTRKLIETVAHAILDRVRSEFTVAEHVRVVIRKLNPPLPGQVGNSLVELNYSRNDV